MRVVLFLVVLVAAAGGGYFAWQYYTDTSSPLPVAAAPVPAVPSAPPAPPAPSDTPAIATADSAPANGSAIDAFPPAPDGAQPRRGQGRRNDAQAQQSTPSPFDAPSLAASKTVSAALPRGMRAMTVPAGALADVVEPGDKVDVLIAHNVRRSIMDIRGVGIEEAPDAKYRPTVAEVLVANAPVLSVRRDAQPASLVIGVGPGDMQKLHLAEGVGSLSVALRSVQDKDRRGKPRVVTSRVLSQVRPRDGGGANSVKIIRGVGHMSAVTEIDSASNEVTEAEESDTNEGEQE